MFDALTFPVVDAHLHVWDPDFLSYPWLADRPLLNKKFLLEDYQTACGSVRVSRMVFIQCEVRPPQANREAEWVTSLSNQDPRLQGIVPWAALEDGDAVRPTLEKLASNQRIKGIRRIIQFEPDMAFCLHPSFVKGVQALSDYDLSFDICINHTQLGNAILLVRQCPNVQFVLDHIAKPAIKQGLLDPWRTQIRELSQLANVVCKVSGLVTEADLEHWSKEQLKPYIDHVIACFGFNRVMYGGDWPVVTEASDYPRWVETLLWAVNGCSVDELTALFGGTAERFYKLT